MEKELVQKHLITMDSAQWNKVQDVIQHPETADEFSIKKFNAIVPFTIDESYDPPTRKIDLSNLKFENLDIFNKNVSHIYFHGSIFTNVVFNSCDLTHNDFTNISFYGCKFICCVFDMSFFEEADITECLFFDCRLDNISIERSQINFCKFDQSSLRRIVSMQNILRENRYEHTKVCLTAFDFISDILLQNSIGQDDIDKVLTAGFIAGFAGNLNPLTTLYDVNGWNTIIKTLPKQCSEWAIYTLANSFNITIENFLDLLSEEYYDVDEFKNLLK